MDKTVSIKRMKTSSMVVAAVMGTISFLLMFISSPLPFAPSFLKLDISDLPSVIGAFAYGPAVGVLIQLIKNLLHLLTNSSTGGVGEFSNFIVGSSYVMGASFLYAKKKTRINAVIGVIVGSLLMTLVGSLSNYFIVLPLYSKIMPIDTIIAMGSAINGAITDKFSLVLYGVVPFNLFKGTLISVITLLVYKRISSFLKKLG